MSLSTVESAGDDYRLKRHIGTVGLLFTAVGSIIGSGWLFGAMNAAQQAGRASIISWLVGAVMILLIGLTYAELDTMFPVSGGVVRFPHPGRDRELFCGDHGAGARAALARRSGRGAAGEASRRCDAGNYMTADHFSVSPRSILPTRL